MTNLGIEILFWIILIIYLGLRITQSLKALDRWQTYFHF